MHDRFATLFSIVRNSIAFIQSNLYVEFKLIIDKILYSYSYVYLQTYVNKSFIFAINFLFFLNNLEHPGSMKSLDYSIVPSAKEFFFRKFNLKYHVLKIRSQTCLFIFWEGLGSVESEVSYISIIRDPDHVKN